MAKDKEAENKEPTTIILDTNDRRWYENLALKEQLIRKQAAEHLQAIAHEVGQMLQQLGAREGVDLAEYDINWQTGEAKPKAKETTP